MDLDLAVNRHLNENKSGLSEEMRELYDMDTSIPAWYPVNDPRKPAQLVVRETLESIIQELFNSRRNLEKQLSRRELLAYDQVLAKYLEHDSLMAKVKLEIDRDYNFLEQQNQQVSHVKDNFKSEQKQLMKERNQQPEMNRGILNEDAYYKLLAYNGSVQKRRVQNKGELEDMEVYAGFENFDQFY